MPVVSIRDVLTATRFPLVALPDRAGDSERLFELYRFVRKSGGSPLQNSYRASKHIQEHAMRKFHSIAALCGDGLRPELQALFDRLAVDPSSELFVRHDGMYQAGPDPASATAVTRAAPPTKNSSNE
jgi:hypothetical protein